MNSIEQVEVPRDSLEWPVHEDYRVQHGTLEAIDKEVSHYDPLRYRELALEFGKLYPEDEIGLANFACTWGLLGQHPFRVPPEQGDSLPWVWGHLGAVRLVLQLHHYLLDRDHEGLARFLDAHRAPADRAPSPKDILIVRTGTPFQFAEGRPTSEPESLAEKIIAGIIDSNLEGLRHRVRSGPLRLFPYCESPMAAIYWHLANIVTGGRHLARCEDQACGALFLVTDGRQRYCPSPPEWRGKTGSLCGARDRKRRERELERQKQQKGG